MIKIQPTAMSVELTSICNLKCLHCFQEEYEKIKTDNNILSHVKETLKTYPTISNILWYGGEPLINKKTVDLLKEGVTYKKNNLVVTNGTKVIPKLDNTHYAVSIDGTKNIHNELRNSDIYDTIKTNITTAINQGLSMNILYCINNLNTYCLDSFVTEWKDSGVKGIVFTQYTPFNNSESDLRLSKYNRKRIVNILHKLKQKHNNFIYNSPVMIELIREEHGKILAKNCLMNVNNPDCKSIHLMNNGKIRSPCAIGDNAIHEDCRNVTKMGLYGGLVLKDKETYGALLRMYNTKGNKNINKPKGI